MQRFERRRKIRRMFYSPLTVIVVLIVVVLLGRSAWGVYKKSRISGEARDTAREELQALQSREKDLSRELKALETESGMEAELRNRLQIVRPGEEVFIILDEKNPVVD